MSRLGGFWIVLLSCLTLNAQSLPDYYTRSRFLFGPAASFDGGLTGFTNPANLSFLTRPELKFFWNNDGTDVFSLRDWGVFTGTSWLGFSVQRQKMLGVGVSDFKLSTATGNRSFSLGLGYGWSAGKQNASGREKYLTFGSIYRPSRHLSLGFIANQSLASSQREAVAELALRPLSSDRLTLFADAALQKGIDLQDAPWSLGGSMELITGVHLVARYFETEQFTLGLTFNLHQGVSGVQTHFDKDANHLTNTYFTRFGAPRKSFVSEKFDKDKFYVPITLKGRVDYLKFKYFDGSVIRFWDVLRNIRAAAQDARVRVVALNLAGLRIRPEHAWEIREALKEVQAAGKEVVVFLERAEMTSYYLASVADQIVCDPQGSVELRGYALGRTYFKGTLAKLGLGFDEWRFFKYKSANEAFSRENMSDADREQLQAFVDDIYELTRTEVSTSRSFQTARFDSLIDNGVHLLADEALASGLVDTLARWSEINGILADLNGRRLRPLRTADLSANAVEPSIWGSANKIALVYGLGICDMDRGIRARWLEQVFLGLAKNDDVKAVVFRVDSPGGDGMASDVVAEAIKKCSESKPVIVSQGQVAASRGYWISANADKIIAGPSTVTGSIGVIWGWLYDTGFGEKLGMTSDLVYRGSHADLGKGVRLPFLQLEVPARNLTDEEIKRGEEIIRKHYATFVSKVAASRGIAEAQVLEIAEGRIYSGIDGKANGLVDEIGGLLNAIDFAKKEAGLDPVVKVEVVEFPSSKGLLNLSQQILPAGLQFENDENMQFLNFLLRHNGTPVPVLLPGTYPDLE